MRKAIATLVLVLTWTMILGSCSGTDDNSRNGITVTDSLDSKEVLVGDIPCSFPIDSNSNSINVLSSVHADTDCDDVYVWNKYKKMTGVDVNWTNVTKNQRDEKVHTALTNQQDVDLIIRCRTTANQITQYGQSKLILDLTENNMLKKYAPNCWEYLQSHPETLASVTEPDGSIYSLPQVNSGPELRVSRKIFINKTWLENVNMDIPKTTEEFYQLLKAFKEKDANGNGDINDEIPLCSQDWISIQDAFFGAFGLANRGVHNQFVDVDEETGKVRLIAASEGYRDYVEYFNRLYEEGLLDKYMFTMTVDQWYNNIKKDKVGVFANTNLAGVPSNQTDNWIAVEEPLEGPNGDKMWTAIRANFHSTGAAMIPATCKDPELVLRWLDYFWTDEGTLFYHMGIEGETFVAEKNGTYDYTEDIYDEMKSENKSFDDVIAKYSPYPGGGNPTVEIAPYFMGGETDDVPARAARKLFKYGPEEYWPGFTFTAEENDVLDVVQTDMTKYIDSMLIGFVSGETSLSQWDAYKAQLEKLGEQQVLDIYSASVDRYYRLTKK